jgi:hypothetical protein
MSPEFLVDDGQTDLNAGVTSGGISEGLRALARGAGALIVAEGVVSQAESGEISVDSGARSRSFDIRGARIANLSMRPRCCRCKSRWALVLRLWLSTAHLLRRSRPFWASRYHDFLTTP